MTTDPSAETIIEFEGRRLRIYFGNRAFRLIERQLGKPILELDAGSIEEITVVIWAGFQTHHADELSLVDDVDPVIDFIGYERLAEIVSDAMQRALPKTPAGGAEATALGNGDGTGTHTSPVRSRPASATRNSGT